MKCPVIINSRGKTTRIKNNCWEPANYNWLAGYLKLPNDRGLMTNKGQSDQSNITPVTEEFKEAGAKHTLSKFEYDLYHEEDDVAEQVIRVKKVSMPNKGEKWKVMIDNKVIFVIESTKISKGEKEYLQTPAGFNFILTQSKLGIKSLNSFRTELKKILKTNKKSP